MKESKPFLKWAGGKTQLINDIQKALPKEFIKHKFNYIEPFVGSGAVLFWMLNNFPKIEKAIINDINSDLTNTYKEIANDLNVDEKEAMKAFYDLEVAKTDYYHIDVMDGKFVRK